METGSGDIKTRSQLDWKNLSTKMSWGEHTLPTLLKQKGNFMTLDKEILNQLIDVFKPLESKIEISLQESSHPKQAELTEMLESLASTSEKIELQRSTQVSEAIQFSLKKNGVESGIKFLGIPGGHEFTSLILAILNLDHKGKLPDEIILQRIKALKGPIDLKTYISLSCENCPDVVQALNLMAIFHPEITHTMVDGEIAQEEIAELKIQGVPSVAAHHKILSVGKTTILELIEKFEQEFGKAEIAPSNKDLGKFDSVIIGGGPAGVSAAIYSARKGLKTAIIAEKFGGQVQDTKGIENLISIPYTEGPELAAKLVGHMAEYPIEKLEYRRVQEIKNGQLKTIHLDSGEKLSTRSIIVATGAKWRELGVPGEREYRGRGVAFCPHCDGPYYKNKDIAVVGGGNSGVEAAIDLAGIVKSVTLIEFAPELKADQVLVKKLKSLSNIKIITNARTAEIKGDEEKVTGLIYEDRANGELKSIDLAGVFVQIGLVPNSAFIKELVETTRFGEIIIDEKGRTNIPGIFAAGDVTTVPYKQIVIAMGEGAKAALSAFEESMLAT